MSVTERIPFLFLERRVGDRPRDGVVLLSRDDFHRSPLGIFGVDLGFARRMKLREGGLKRTGCRARHRISFIEGLRFALGNAVGECEPELLVAEHDRAFAVGRVGRSRATRL